jgi:hypothetical protein
LNASEADPIALFERKRVIGRFQRYVWAPLDISRLDVGFEIKSVGITRKFISQPSKIRWFVDDFWVAPEIN